MEKILSTVLSVSIVILGSYILLEPEMLNAELGPGAGPYSQTIAATLTVNEEISMSTTTDIAMPAMGVTVNSSAGGDSTHGIWTIKTNNVDGWEVKFHASTTPALQSASSTFADYHSTSSIPSLWSVNASAVEFGFSALGNKVLTMYASSTDTLCTSTNNYTPNNHLQYMAFSGVTDILLAQDTGKTATAGISTTLCVAAGQNGVYATSSVYTANITATGAVK